MWKSARRWQNIERHHVMIAQHCGMQLSRVCWFLSGSCGMSINWDANFIPWAKSCHNHMMIMLQSCNNCATSYDNFFDVTWPTGFFSIDGSTISWDYCMIVMQLVSHFIFYLDSSWNHVNFDSCDVAIQWDQALISQSPAEYQNSFRECPMGCHSSPFHSLPMLLAVTPTASVSCNHTIFLLWGVLCDRVLSRDFVAPLLFHYTLVALQISKTCFLLPLKPVSPIFMTRNDGNM